MAREARGRFLGIPYNWDSLSRRDAGRGLWDPEYRRLFPPKNLGWGYGLNMAELKRRLTGR